MSSLGGGSSKPSAGENSLLGPNIEEIKPAIWQVRNDLIIRTHRFYELQNGTLETKKVTERKPISYGSGFSISPELIVTNFHVITNTDGNTEITFNRDKSINLGFFSRARLLRVSSIYDLALLQIEGEKKIDKWLPIRTEPPDPARTRFFLFGYPDTRFIRLQLDFHRYVNDAVIRFKRGDSIGRLSGASGGPVVDENGHVMAVFHASSHPSSVEKPAYASAIFTNALNDFLNGNGRDCSQITEEECVNQEWIYLERNARTGSHSLAQYELGLFGEYEAWREKRNAFKNFTQDLALFNSAVDEAMSALSDYNEARDRRSYEAYQSAIEELREAEDRLNHSLETLNRITESG